MAFSSNRRQLLLSTLSAAAYATPLSGFLLNACKTTSRAVADDTGALASDTALVGLTIRKSATDPSNAKNIELYRKAVGAMKATKFPMKVQDQEVTWWEAHAEIHNNFCPHGNWYFLPWHRGYLHYFERVCRVFCDDPSFALPYWDWTEDSRLPEAFTIGNESTNSLFNATRSISPRQALNLKECEAEFVKGILAISDFATFAGGAANRPRAIDSSIKNEMRGFTGRLEAGPHNKVHATMQGDMGTFVSPRDPVFWLHHCNVDRLWTSWVAERTLKSQDILPMDKSIKDVKDQKDPKAIMDATLNREYWLKSKITGYYTATKEGDVYKAADAFFTVNDVFDAISMGLAYQPYVKGATPVVTEPTAQTPVTVPAVPQTPVATTPVPQPPVATAPTPVPQPPVATAPTPTPIPTTPAMPVLSAPVPPEVPAEPSSPEAVVATTSPAPAVSTVPVIPAPITAKTLKGRWKAASSKVITLKTSFVSSFSLAQSAPTVVRIAASSELDDVLFDASKDKGVKEATLRLVVRNIPFPTNPLAELHFYLNSNNPSGEESNPQFIGSMSFFGHKHADATVSAAFDLVPTVKKMAKAGQPVFTTEADRKAKGAQPQTLQISAVWKSNTKNDDLSALALSLDYLQLNTRS